MSTIASIGSAKATLAIEYLLINSKETPTVAFTWSAQFFLEQGGEGHGKKTPAKTRAWGMERRPPKHKVTFSIRVGSHQGDGQIHSVIHMQGKK